MKKRCLSELTKFFAFIAAGFIYYLTVTYTSFKIPCPVNYFTGLLCPGCGITRMTVSAVNLDFKTAFGYNKAVFVTLPIIIFFFIYEEIRYIRNGSRRNSKITNIFLFFEIILLTVFGIVRNII